MSESPAQTFVPITITPRSIRQDAENAMRGDPIRALIELITNSDDAYGGSPGRILVRIERGLDTWKFSVHDRAKGMTQREMTEKLLTIGGRVSGYEKGENVRGNLGRGAKDVAVFGVASFQSVKNDQYVHCEIKASAMDKGEFVTPTRPATPEDRKSLGIHKGSGTVVTVTVTNNARCPQFRVLTRDLRNHFQLRDILSAENREVILEEHKRGRTIRLRHETLKAKEVIHQEIEVEGYPDGPAILRIFRLDSRDDDGPTSPTSRSSGLLIKGSKAIYENTFFSAESRPNARWFRGEVICPHIDVLARERDDLADRAPSKANPIGIIRRDRDGLQRNHPYYEALKAAIDPILARLIDEEDEKYKRESARLSDRLSKDLTELGRALGEMFAEDIEDTDEEFPDANRGSEEEPIKVIPGRIVAYMGEPKTISVHVLPNVGASRVRVTVLPEDLMELAPEASTKLKDRKVNIKLEPKRVGQGVITFHVADKHQTVECEVRASRPEPPPAPESLQFEYESYSVKLGRSRRIRLLAPEGVVYEHGDLVQLSVAGSAIVRLGGQLRMFPNDDGIFECRIDLEAREQSGSVRLLATLGDTQAEARAHVANPKDEQGHAFNIVLENDKKGANRALVDGSLIRILAAHPALVKLLGPGPEFPLQDEPQGRAAIAEVVATEITRKVVEAKYRSRELDAATVYFEHHQLLSKYLPKCQKMLGI